jgi:glycosyltransferase involved in cell wall biosynthesis
VTSSARPRCLWLARALPFPQDSGDRIYSAELARALALAGGQVHFVGLATDAAGTLETEVPGDWPVEWHAVRGGPAARWRAAASLQPLNGALHDTPAYRQVLVRLLDQDWDLIVIDHYGMGWALPAVRDSLRNRMRHPILIHIAHNHEATVWRDMARAFRGPALRQLALWQNLLKVRRVERQLARSVDLLGCITQEDAKAFAVDPDSAGSVVLTPGFRGLEMPDRALSSAVPRRVVMLGSFRWVIKQENLKALAAHADARFREHGIALDVIGDVPAPLRAALSHCASITLHGFVEDVAPFFRQSRMAVVPELIGGGFKLKFLDYVFGRVPVVTLDEAAAGLPPQVRRAMLGCRDLTGLVDTVIARIDDFPALDRLQREAITAARSAFDWSERGQALLNAAVGARRQRARIEPAGCQVW